MPLASHTRCAGAHTGYWINIPGPIVRAVLAAVIALVLGDPDGVKAGSVAAQGDFFVKSYEAQNPERSMDQATSGATHRNNRLTEEGL